MTKRTFIIIVSFSVLLNIYFFSITSKYPYIGLEVDTNGEEQLFVKKLDSTGAAMELGIKEGDVILSINNVDPHNNRTVTKYSLIEQADTITIKRGNAVITYDLLVHGYIKQFFYHNLFPFLLLMLTQLFSFLLFIKKKQEKSTFALIILLQLYGISMFSGAASSVADPIAQFIAIGILLLIPLLLLHFFYTYFQKYDIKLVSYLTLKILYFTNFTVIGLSLLFLNLPLGSTFYVLSRLLVLLMFVINLLFTIWLFGRSFIKYRKSFYGTIFKIIIIGSGIAFLPFFSLYALPTIFLKTTFISGELGFLCTSFLPLTLVYLVIAHRLLDIDLYIRRIFYYSLLAIVPAVTLTIVSINFFTNFSYGKAIGIFILYYLVMIIVLYIKEDLDYRFRNKIFSEKHNLQSSIYQFVDFLSREKNKLSIEKYYISEIKSVLGLKNAALLKYDKQYNKLENGTEFGDIHDVFIKQLLEYNRKYMIGELYEADSHYYLLAAENKRIALLVVLEGKQNLTSFNADEKEWLKTISYFMNITYQNLQLIEELIAELEFLRTNENAPEWVLRMLFQLEEKERKRLSIDLHDAALQDQLLLYRKLTEILEKYKLEPNVKQELNFVNEGMLDVIYEIRETCNELMPPFLKETGIIASLENLFKKAQLRTNIVVDFYSDLNKHTLLNDEIALTIFRVVQELLNNAQKHSDATNVEFALFQQQNSLFLTYKDNGNGIDEEKVTTMKENIGFYGIKERIRSVNGKIELSNSTNGVEIDINIPLEQSEKILVIQ